MFEADQTPSSFNGNIGLAPKNNLYENAVPATHFLDADLSLLSAREIHHLIQTGHYTVEEYALSLLRRVQERDPLVKAWVHLDEKNVLKQARELDKLSKDQRGPLHGVAVGIKDVALTKDMPTRYHSPIHANDEPSPNDAAVVSVLRSAGALIFGKTATTEFAATSKGGPCANPLNLAHTPGGSSSGSAAAVADFHVPISLGTQTGGSMIRPGSFTGIYAFKPTWGVISSEGLGRFSITCDTPGFYTRSIDDLDLLAKVYQIYVNFGPRSLLRSLSDRRVAFVKTSVWPRAGPGTQAAWEQYRSLLSSNGTTIVDLDLPDIFSHCPSWRSTVVAAEARAAFLPQYLRDKDQLDESLVKLVEKHSQPNPKELLEAYNGIGQLRWLWDEISSNYDFVITPSVPDEAPFGLESTGSSCFCAMWTILHVPCLNVPGFKGKNGLPIGLAITGPRYSDMRVLDAGKLVGSLLSQAY